MPALFRAIHWLSALGRPMPRPSPRLLCVLAALLPVVVMGQGALGPAGSEYPLGAFSGDQVKPRLAVGPKGGWVVWQDNVIDGRSNGLGIAASRLNSSFAQLTNRIRVNTTLAGDQIKPDAALLGNGNAAFAWEGGGFVSPAIYARFMGASGSFVSNEIKITSSALNITNKWTTNIWAWVSNRWVFRSVTLYDIVTGSRQQSHDPAVAGLTNGAAVIVYSGTRKYTHSWNEMGIHTSTVNSRPMTNTGSYWFTNAVDAMEEIFFQRFANNGARLAGETLVNQFSANNQRSPAVAALPNGNFVIVWISEQQFPSPVQMWVVPGTEPPVSVVVSARLYNAAGQPLTDEFRIDGIAPAICSQPTVAPAADGGFLVAWGQKSPRSSSDRWDVFGRQFGSDATPRGAAFRINSYTAGDQYAPQIASQGLDQLVVWTSFGQDGSMEGVYGRYVSEGVLAGEEFRVNTTTRNKQIQPAVAGTAGNRFLAVWSHYAGLANGFDLMAQKYGYLPALPAPDAPQVTATDTASLMVSWPAATAQNLLDYLLYMDGSATAIKLTAISYQATGLDAGSTHSFRLAYELSDGSRARLSTPALGTTLVVGQTPGGTQISDNNNANNASGTNTTVTTTSGLPRITLTRNGPKLAVQWNSEAGASYQIQVSTNLSVWTNLGAPRAATNATSVQNYVLDSQVNFYRVVRIP